jgi:hypothetical protein
MPTNQMRSTGTHPIFGCTLDERLLQSRITGKAQIVIAGKIRQRSTVYSNLDTLPTLQQTPGSVESLIANFLPLRLKPP